MVLVEVEVSDEDEEHNNIRQKKTVDGEVGEEEKEVVDEKMVESEEEIKREIVDRQIQDNEPELDAEMVVAILIIVGVGMLFFFYCRYLKMGMLLLL